jgi:glycosyltransferase involved in cell wall biosynthesis
MSELENELLISVIIATLNEEPHIERAIRGALGGKVDPRRIEVIVADGGSTDRTREIVTALAGEFPGSVRLIDNPRRIAPAAFNVGMLAARGKYLCILSAHGSVDENYFQVCLDKLAAADDVDVVGGTEIILPFDTSTHARMMMAILSSRFGVGASSRNSQTEGTVDTIAPGLFRRRVFERIGMFDERLVRNQDNELNSRLVHSGGTIYMIPTIKSYYCGRRDPRKLLNQCYANGIYGILTWRINPSSFRLRHAIPLFFFAFLVCGGIVALTFPMFAWLYAGVLALYGVLAVAASVEAGLKFKLPAAVLFPGLFLAMHVCYGLGTFLGIFRFGIKTLPPNQVQKLPPRQ